MILATAWMNLENMLSERSQKCPEEANPFLKSTSVDARGWMEGGRGSDCLMDMGFLWGLMKRFWN